MVRSIQEHFPESVSYTIPEGGMFLWVTLPENISSMEVFERALEEKVAVLPGIPFYTDGGGYNTLRLNFTNSSHEKIEDGIIRLSRVLNRLLEKSGR